MSSPPSPSPPLSNRGLSALQQTAPLSLRTSYTARTDRFNPQTNPSGHIDLSLSENLLSLPLLHDRLSTLPFPPPSLFLYDDSHGSLAFRHQLARLFARHFLPQHAPLPSPHHFVAACGAGACLDLLATVLCDPADRILLLGPGYGGFARDLCKRAATSLVVASIDTPPPPSVSTPPASSSFCHVSVAAFESAWHDAGAERSRIKFMLVCSPHNPTGEVLSPSLIRHLVAWGRERALHIVFDEAYALSTYAEGVHFCSVAHALNGELRHDVHIVWTFSKDFCWSGARVGVIFSCNDVLLDALRPALTYLTGVSRQTQWTLTKMMEDCDWVDGFVRQNRANLLRASRKTASLLSAHAIPYFPAEAGLFLWIDLRTWMKEQTKEEEIALWQRMAKQKVLLTPASESFGKLYGYFRLCFAAVDEQAVHVAIERLTRGVLTMSP